MSEGVFYVNVWQYRRTGEQVFTGARFLSRTAALMSISSPRIKRIGLLRVTPKGGSNDER